MFGTISMLSRKIDIYAFLIIFLLVLNGGTLIKVMGYGPIFQIFTLIVLFVILTFSNSFSFKKIFRYSFFILLPLFIINLLHGLIFDNYILLSNQIINLSVSILIGVIISIYFEGKSSLFSNHLNLVLKLFVIQGILSSLILSLYPTRNILIKSTGDGSAYVGYLYLFFQRIHINYLGQIDLETFNLFGLNIFRAHGFFWEPSVFSVYVNIFIFLNLFVAKNNRNVLIGFLGILLSWSTTGMAVVLIQLIYYAGINFKLNLKNILTLGSLSIFLVIVGYVATINVNDKLYGEKAGSSAQRYVDTMAAIDVIIHNPAIGIGVEFKNFNQQIKDANPDLSGSIGSSLAIDRVNENTFSNSLLRVFVYFGLIFGTLLVWAFFKQNLITEHPVLFAIVNLTAVSFSPILFLTFHFTFIVNGLINIFNKRTINISRPKGHFGKEQNYYQKINL
ncbi:O-antigen ligase family protein [Namhaeicola litoreus]|uniref:O-antigen ligase family protein n=1 Tax=Namhaeicola litoreus TaxID=1052145 RepID=A0ABW3Y7L9_9FLAO